jgi:hypothetical protein
VVRVAFVVPRSGNLTALASDEPGPHFSHCRGLRAKGIVVPQWYHGALRAAASLYQVAKGLTHRRRPPVTPAPAKVGIHDFPCCGEDKSRIRAFAGMTGAQRKNQSYRHLTLPE